MENAKICNNYNLDETIAKDYLAQFTYPWEALAGISDYIKELGPTLDKEVFEEVAENVWVAKSAEVAPGAHLGAPLIVDENAKIGHCAFIRTSAIIGNGAYVGTASELKNVILFNGVQVPHYNYVGDSVLGNKAHMGAGSICSNLKSDGKAVVIHGDEDIETGIRKIGAMLGDFAEIGCNSVLNPGTVIGKNSNVYPLSPVRGVVPANHIYKNKDNVVAKR